MSPSLLIQKPDIGLLGSMPANILDPRAAAKGTQNVFYEYGLIRTPDGFAKLDMSDFPSGLNSGDTVLAVFPYRENDGYEHLIAKTTEKIYEHDRANSTWSDKTQSGLTMGSSINYPISYIEVGHDDTDIYLDGDSSKSRAYFHMVVSDGGQSNIQRWAGRYEVDFADVLGGDGYHDGTTNRALQVGMFQNRVILLNPLAYNSGSATWIKNYQRLRWSAIGKLETYTGTGSGFVDLLNTGGLNVWSAPLGGQYIVYQDRGIWTVNYVGGTTVFDPRVAIPDLGLKAWHLLISYNNVHYFIGTDSNVHAYYGGTVRQNIGDPIHKYLQEDLDPVYNYRCWMSMGTEGKRLWIFIVPSGSTYVTKAYVRNMVTGSWTIRDFASKWSTGGISAVSLVGAQNYAIGDTYADALDTNSPYPADATKDAAYDVTQRYGDMLLDTSRTLTLDYTAGTWSAGGFDYSKAAEGFGTDFTENDILVTFDGSNAANLPYGTHFYTVYDVSTNGFSVYPTSDASAPDDRGIADNSTNTPGDLSVAGEDTIGFYSACTEDAPGQTYRQSGEEILVQPHMVLGDSDGFIYQVDATYTKDDDNIIDCRHFSPILDWGQPDKEKRWPGVSVVAEGTVGGAMYVSYRTGNFDTSDTGWTDFSFDLTSQFTEKSFWLNVTSKTGQIRFKDFSGNSFAVKEFKVFEPLVEGNI